jgi:hypothetical protein
MRRVLLLIAALVLLPACGGGGGVAIPTTTAVHVFSPWTEDGTKNTVPVKGTGSGQCIGPSSKVTGAGIYRCLVGASIQDPCFAPPNQPNPQTLACASDPWSGITLVTLTGSLPAPEDDARVANDPHWAIELENGDTCSSVGGTAGSSGGVAMPYLCKSGSSASDTSKVTQPWTAQYNKNRISFDLVPLKVVAAW